MALGDLDGIANVQFGQFQDLTFETAQDWDDGSGEEGVQHENTANTQYGDDTRISLGYPTNRLLQPTNLQFFYLLQEQSGGTAYDFSGNNNDGANQGANPGGTSTNLWGRTGWTFDSTNNEYVTTGVNNNDSDFTLAALFRTTANLNSPFMSTWSDGNALGPIFGISPRQDNFGGTNGQVGIAVRGDGSEQGEVEKYEATDAAYNDGNLHLAVVTVGGFGNTDLTVRMWVDGVQQNLTQVVDQGRLDQSHTAEYNLGRMVNDGNYYEGSLYGAWYWDVALSQTDAAAFANWGVGDSRMDTGIKSFPTATGPDLKDLDYALNGESLTLEVVGSPGTASEEIQSQVLDGGTAYTLTWNSTHADFLVRPVFNAPFGSSTPTLNRVVLEG